MWNEDGFLWYTNDTNLQRRSDMWLVWLNHIGYRGYNGDYGVNGDNNHIFCPKSAKLLNNYPVSPPAKVATQIQLKMLLLLPPVSSSSSARV